MITAEILKIRTTSAGKILAVVALATMTFTLLVGLLAPTLLPVLAGTDSKGIGYQVDTGDQDQMLSELMSAADPSSADYQRGMLDVLGNGSLGSGGGASVIVICAVLLGVFAATSEFRFGGIVPTALVVPNRSRMLLGKAAAVAAVSAVGGVVLALLTGAALLVGVGPAADGGILVAPTEMATIWLRGIVLLVLYALVGLGLGTLIRSQVAALVLVFCAVLVEAVIPSLFQLITGSIPLLVALLPFGLGPVASTGTVPPGVALLGGTQVLGPAVATGALVLWSLLALGAGLLSLHRRDLV
ncbi:hypothetical protein MF406_17020 [Georgenia sp. TF02-10]|uniref:hypothetical protein n=1 Tax=Georgenia sp. TF02-10 TaxID=2917725 RepID=UPI001FA7B0B2|nr:hypothetical protein [Georgenia sp. TF02-10]UNX54559.1 hypothetical protein MF406_17020 [Georgenia sp. TF02-10]